MSRIKKYKWWIIIIIICCASGAIYYINKNNTDANMQVVQTTAMAERGDISVTVSGTGQVYADDQVDLQPQVAGDGLDVVEVTVTNDQQVSKGDLIAVLDATDIQKDIQKSVLLVRSSEIQLKQTQKEYDKQTEDDKYMRQLKEVSLAQDQLSLSNAYSDLEDYYIRAPFDGIVTGLDVSTGDSIARDEILASVITQKVHAVIALNEVDAAQVKNGNVVSLTFDALDGVEATGVVSKVDTIGVVDQGVVTYDVEIAFDSPSELLKPGMSVSAEIVINEVKDVVTVPAEAIKSGRDKVSFVMIKESTGETKRVSVETGLSDDVIIEVISGVSEGQEVVVGSTTPSAQGTAKKSSSAGSIMPMSGPSSGRRN